MMVVVRSPIIIVIMGKSRNTVGQHQYNEEP
jgi:hypothetical protein